MVIGSGINSNNVEMALGMLLICDLKRQYLSDFVKTLDSASTKINV